MTCSWSRRYQQPPGKLGVAGGGPAVGAGKEVGETQGQR